MTYTQIFLIVTVYWGDGSNPSTIEFPIFSMQECIQKQKEAKLVPHEDETKIDVWCIRRKF